MAWQSIISSHPTTDPRSRLFRCGSIILLIDKLKVGGGPSLSSGSETADHLIHTCFCAAISRTIAELSCTRASLLSPHLHRESLPSGSKRAQRHGGSDSGAARTPTSRKPAPWPLTVGPETDEVRREAVQCPSW